MQLNQNLFSVRCYGFSTYCGTIQSCCVPSSTHLSPVPDLEILLEVNLNFQVRLTIILACGIFSQANGSGSSMLKYNDSKPSLLKISVELDRQINLKQFCVISIFLQINFWCLLKLSLTAAITYSITARQIYGSETLSAK